MNEYIKKVLIQGNYYDTYLYKKVLILIHADKTISSYNWEKMVDSFNEKETDRLAYECAFKNSKFFYNPDYLSFYKDDEFRSLVVEKIKRIKDIQLSNLYPNSKYLISSKYKKIDCLPTDIVVYKNIFYFTCADGVFYKKISSLSYYSPHALSPSTYYLTDKKAVNLNVSNGGYLYLSTLDDGLWVYLLNRDFEYSDILVDKKKNKNLKKISKEHSSFVNSNYSSIFIGSHYSESLFYEIYYDKKKRKSKPPFNIKQLFTYKGKSFFITGQDKMYQFTNSGLYMVQFIQSKIISGEEFSSPKLVIERQFDIDLIVSASVELFGIVIEFKDKLEILLSDGKIETIEFYESLINWRTFPRSHNYTNQLHLVFSNHIEIISINHDFLINQIQKRIGIRYADFDYYRDKIDY